MPKLPANLPENWTQGQTISPNGTEVGLTEQHGYNYLMKQVNNTQTEVNNINTALTDVAQQATLEEVKQTGIETQQTVNETKTTIGDIGDPAGEESLVGLIKDIPEKVPTGAVKSVQRGVAGPVSYPANDNYVIKINNVNPEKCQVSLRSWRANGTDQSYGDGGYVLKLSETELVLCLGEDMTISWEVTEYY